MIVFLNGEFVSEERAVVSVFDRSFRYGDGLFETVLARNGKLFRWQEHFLRLHKSAAFLRIRLPFTSQQLECAARELLAQNSLHDALVRITLSRGSGPPGYAFTGEETSVISITVAPSVIPGSNPWKLISSTIRVAPGDPLMQHKTANRLVHVLAAREAQERDADEALLLDTNGCITEGASSNIFWIDGGAVCTPPLSAGLLPGVTRAAVLEICGTLGLVASQRVIAPAELKQCAGAFMSLTSRGVIAAASLDGTSIRHSAITDQIARNYQDLVAAECS